MEDLFFVEDLHVHSVLFFHQEKSFQDLCEHALWRMTEVTTGAVRA
jgi:hypothetical protein